MLFLSPSQGLVSCEPLPHKVQWLLYLLWSLKALIACDHFAEDAETSQRYRASQGVKDDVQDCNTVKCRKQDTALSQRGEKGESADHKGLGGFVPKV